jgi:hypothetical protein
MVQLRLTAQIGGSVAQRLRASRCTGTKPLAAAMLWWRLWPGRMKYQKFMRFLHRVVIEFTCVFFILRPPV